MNLQMHSEKAFVDQSDIDFDEALRNKSKSEDAAPQIPTFDPNEEDEDNIEVEEAEDVDSEEEIKNIDDEEEAKQEADEEYEVIESDFEKQLKNRKIIHHPVSTLNELYVDDPNEDEIFSKDVNVLDMVNTTYLNGRLRLTRYKLVFQPVVKVNVNKPGSQSKETKYELMRLPKYRANYFKIPVHMIYSVKEVSDKKNPQ
jgi:hypothetical protein